MSTTCSHNCGSCSAKGSCGEQKAFERNSNQVSRVRHVIAVMSGKGGVGKSMVTSLLATLAAKQGYRTAVLDADITGPSIPKAFGLHERATADETGIYPVKTAGGISVMSINVLVDEETKPVLWRGPIIAATVKQFWTDVYWGDIDYMFVDMPPGTGDVPLTVFQSLPVEGVVIVTSPQELVGMIVEKAVHMTEQMQIPILGIVENMSYFECPGCHERMELFGASQVVQQAERFDIPVSVRMPINSTLAGLCDAGQVEAWDFKEMNEEAEALLQMLPKA